MAGQDTSEGVGIIARARAGDELQLTSGKVVTVSYVHGLIAVDTGGRVIYPRDVKALVENAPKIDPRNRYDS